MASNRDRRVKKLQDILDQVILKPEFAPEKNSSGEIKKTYCNMALLMTASLLDYWGFVRKGSKDPMLANAITAYMADQSILEQAHQDWEDDKSSEVSGLGKEPARGEWLEMDGDDAFEVGWAGAWVVAAAYGKQHGHVASVYPGGKAYSGKWKKECPVIANVGQRNGKFGANWCFEKEPRYFAYVPHLDELEAECAGS